MRLTPESVAAIVVTYQPDLAGLRALLDALRPQVGALVVVDNASSNAAQVRNMAADADCAFISEDENVGVAAAQNAGIEWALKAGFDAILLSDQDSIPAASMVARLVAALEAAGPKTAAVGPVPTDERGEESLVSGFAFWRPKRAKAPGPAEVLSVPVVIASGMLIPRRALGALGLMDQGLFIDNVDTAWCLNAISRGWGVYVVGDAHLLHSLGSRVTSTAARKRPVHLQSPVRNYYIVRNTITMVGANFVPARWKVGYLAWLVKVIGYYALAAPDAAAQRPMLWRGLIDGVKGKSGPFTAG